MHEGHQHGVRGATARRDLIGMDHAAGSRAQVRDLPAAPSSSRQGIQQPLMLRAGRDDVPALARGSTGRRLKSPSCWLRGARGPDNFVGEAPTHPTAPWRRSHWPGSLTADSASEIGRASIWIAAIETRRAVGVRWAPRPKRSCLDLGRPPKPTTWRFRRRQTTAEQGPAHHHAPP